MTQKIFTEKRKKSGSHSTMTSRYLAHIALAPGVRRLIGDGKLVGVGVDGEEGGVKCASDFSYSAPSYAGNGYRIVGDAGGMCPSTSPIAHSYLHHHQHL